MIEIVNVLDVNGQPLMPTKRLGKVRHLLNSNKAKVVKGCPFTIQLQYKSTTYTQPITLGVDAGSKTIGLSASTEIKEVYSSEVILRNDIVDLLSTRRENRRTRRSHKTRYRAPRFSNRRSSKKEGWIAPSIRNKIDAHIKAIDDIVSILPLSNIIIETASFDIQKIKAIQNGFDIPEGVDYQNGEQKDFWNVREYVLWRDGHECQCCKNKKSKILNVHHIESRKTGGNAPSNLITLCDVCHDDYHKGKIKLNLKKHVSYKDAAFMSIMRWNFYNAVKDKYESTIKVSSTFGYITKNIRIENNLPKGHRIDALCIAGHPNVERLKTYLLQKKRRRHNRQIHKMKILKGNKRPLNQSSFEVKGYRLFDKVKFENKEYYIWGRRTSGSFLLKDLENNKKDGVSYKKLKLKERAKGMLKQILENTERSQGFSSHD